MTEMSAIVNLIRGSINTTKEICAHENPVLSGEGKARRVRREALNGWFVQ